MTSPGVAAAVAAYHEQKERERECYDVVHHKASVVFKCKHCDTKFRMRKRKDGEVLPGPIEYIIAHAQAHLHGRSMSAH